MQPPEVNIPAWSTNMSNVSPIENDITVGDLPELKANPRRHGFGAQRWGFAINPNAMPVASGSRNPYIQPGNPYPGTHQHLGKNILGTL